MPSRLPSVCSTHGLTMAGVGMQQEHSYTIGDPQRQTKTDSFLKL